MKKKMSTARKMRLTAACLYFLLAAYQMFVAQHLLRRMVVSQAYGVWVYAYLLVFAAGAMAVWMFSSQRLFSPGTIRGVIAGTALVVIYELFTYAAQTEIINYTLYNVFPSLYDKAPILYFFVIVRLMLLIVAAFFVAGNRKEMDYVAVKGKTDDVRLDITEEKADGAAAAGKPAEDWGEEPWEAGATPKKPTELEKAEADGEAVADGLMAGESVEIIVEVDEAVKKPPEDEWT